MNNNKKVIKVDGISKCYRIGQKEEMHDTLVKTILNAIKSPVKNYRKYRSLYKFDDMRQDSDRERSDVIWALRNVSFEVSEGEIVGIIGLNGSGKSTLLKILSKITEPTQGRAEIDGKISSLLEVGTGFHPELTGRENIYFNGSILGMKKKEIDQKFDEIVDFSGVEKFIDTPVKRYSSGMRVRLAFAVAAQLEPEIVLIDEVLAVGDMQFQKKCLNKMKDIGMQGRTVLFVSHNMQAVTRLCPRSILLKSGEIVADGLSHKIVAHYMNSERTTRAERSWVAIKDAPGDDIVRLINICVRGENEKLADAADIRNPIIIEVEYVVLKPNYIFMIYFHVVNDEGVEVFLSIDSDPKWRNQPRPAGKYVSRATIPGNLMSEGIHFITLGIRTMNPNIRHLRVEDAVAFHVVDSLDGDSARVDFGGDVKGIVRPLLKWQTFYGERSEYK